MGLYPGLDRGPIPLGGECSGRVVAVGEGVTHVAVGDEVVAIGGHSHASRVVVPAGSVVRRPATLTSEEGAAVPLVFMTAWYALRQLAHLEPGEKILIHSAAGGTGLAALQVAQLVGAEVFATAGSEAKRAYLRSLGVKHVMDSRSFAFVDEILATTGGRGVDVVLNSLAGEAIEKSLSVLAPDGRFLELGKRDIYAEDRTLSMVFFRRRVSYHPVDLVGVGQERPEKFVATLRAVMNAFARGELRPVPIAIVPVRRSGRWRRRSTWGSSSSHSAIPRRASSCGPVLRCGRVKTRPT
jgi:NADPH:quinone reductase-like Zn-dependent oxidoreductase